MAYDDELADRIRDALSHRDDVEERKMFGGLAFMVAGHMAVGIVGAELMVRLGQERAAAALAEEHVRPMDFTGRPAARGSAGTFLWIQAIRRRSANV